MTRGTDIDAFRDDVARAGLRMHHLLREQAAEIAALREEQAGLRLDLSELAWTIRQLVLAAGDTVPPDLIARIEAVVG